MAIIALSGYVGAGKDLTATIMRDLLLPQEWEIKAFATKLKQVASILTDIPIEKWSDQEFKKSYLGPEWDKWTEERFAGGVRSWYRPMTGREFLQTLGTDAIGKVLHWNAFVNGLFNTYSEDSKWIITDVRYPNEAEAVTKRGGKIIRIVKGCPVNLHVSETSLDDYEFDHYIYNDRGIDDLTYKVRDLLIDMGYLTSQVKENV